MNVQISNIHQRKGACVQVKQTLAGTQCTSACPAAWGTPGPLACGWIIPRIHNTTYSRVIQLFRRCSGHYALIADRSPTQDRVVALLRCLPHRAVILKEEPAGAQLVGFLLRLGSLLGKLDCVKSCSWPKDSFAQNSINSIK